MEIIKYNPKNHSEIVKKATKILKSGGIFVFPTETCYGLGADATNKKAIEKLYKYKRRREGKPLSVAVSDSKMAQKYVEINEIAQNLYDNYLPGPITVVSKSLGKVVKEVESEYGTLGIRIPDHKLVLDIIAVSKDSSSLDEEKKIIDMQKIIMEISEDQLIMEAVGQPFLPD